MMGDYSISAREIHVPLSFALSIVLAASLPASGLEPTLTPEETLIRLNVSPMPAPKPALRYLLLPDLNELSPGNPIEGYLKCLLEDSGPTGKELLSRESLKKVDHAARLDKPDWQILAHLKTDGVYLLLPDLQKHRYLAASLQDRMRSEIAQGHTEEALVTAKTMFALSQHTGMHPTLIGNLVGIAIANVAIVPLEELLDKPDCPNLYWALTNLPYPLVSIDKGVEGERVMVEAELRGLSTTEPMSSAQLKKLIERIDLIRHLDGPPQYKTSDWLAKRATDQVYVAAARERLVEYGIREEISRKFPPEQVVILDEKREYEIGRDDATKTMKLPTWQVEELNKEMKVDKENRLFFYLLPAMQKVRRAQGRLEQRIALLRHVEAIRMYAAEHKGQLPEKLSDITLPLPVDPFTASRSATRWRAQPPT
jgi:hypothetical protein